MKFHLNRSLAGVAALIGFVPVALVAQQATTVTGRVLADTVGLENVAVSIPALRVGSYTDRDGRYIISAPATATGQTVTVVARRIGYTPDSVRVTLSGETVTQDIRLRATATTLTGIVITAGSVAREKSTLGTAQQQISAEELTTTKAMNVVEQVQG